MLLPTTPLSPARAGGRDKPGRDKPGRDKPGRDKPGRNGAGWQEQLTASTADRRT